MDFTVPIKKEAFLEVAIDEVDDVLMDIREQIFNELKQKEVSSVQIKVAFTYFENKEQNNRKKFKKEY